MKGKRGRPSMEDELFRVLNQYLESIEKVNDLTKKGDEAYAAWGRYRRAAEEETARAASLLKTVREWKKGVEIKRRGQNVQPVPMPDNVITLEQR